jgi:hypothetical protein
MSRNSPGAGFRRLPRIADQMTPDLMACVERAIEAERAGDLASALEWHQAVPMFRRGRHRIMLQRLAELGPDLPAWVWARWIVYLAIRCEDGVTGRLGKQVLNDMVNTVHADLLERCHEEGGDPVRIGATVLGESWVLHQVLAHEAGGLAGFLDEFVTGELAERGELVRRWVGARLGGYQLGESVDGTRLRVRPAGGAEWMDVLDLGARSCAAAPGFVLGRLVPSGVEDLPMFDMPPLGVPERIAHEVAAAPVDRRWRPVWLAVEEGRLTSDDLLREDYELTTDVLELELVRFGTERRDLARVMRQLREGRDESSRAAYRVLSRARAGEIDPTDQAYVAAASLLPKAYDDARRRLARPGDQDVWTAWADRVTGPARGRLLALAAAARVPG